MVASSLQYFGVVIQPPKYPQIPLYRILYNLPDPREIIIGANEIRLDNDNHGKSVQVPKEVHKHTYH